MKNVEVVLLALALSVVGAACPDFTNVPCAQDDNCPTSYVCSCERVCIPALAGTTGCSLGDGGVRAGGAGGGSSAGGVTGGGVTGGGVTGGGTTGGGTTGGSTGGGFGSGGSGGGAAGGVRSVGEVPTEFAQLMVQYLDYYQENFAAGGGSAGVQDVATGLRAGGEYRWNVGTLRGGQTYTFLGACDNDCSDVDIIVEDENGINVGEDLLTDDYPVVTITPRRDGPFTARILLVNCSIEPCYVGGRVLQQGR